MVKEFMCHLKCDLPESDRDKIIVHGAREHNLKNICFAIPKGKLVALTGPSGSGKSSIAVEVLQKECLRQFLESLGMTTDHLSKPDVDQITGLSPSIGVSQRVADFNPRSTVGTRTGILTILRNLFAAIGHQPFGQPQEKLKMAHFSFNAAAGACESCQGAGEVFGVDLSKLLDEEKTLRNGGVRLWDEGTAKYYEGVIQAAAKYYQFPFDTNVPIRSYTKEQKDFLLYGTACPEFVKTHKNFKTPKKVSEGKFEGVVPYLLGRYKNAPTKLPPEIRDYMTFDPCPECRGSRLGKLGREVTVGGKTITEVAGLDLCQLLEWIQGLEAQVSKEELQALAAVSSALEERVLHLIEVGLDYLTLDRTLPSLSAGESQRLKLACVLGSGLTGVLYVLDEPTTGLHPHDTAKLLKTLRKIQETGNTVLIIEHDPDMIKRVDYIINIGPGGGSQGGEIVAVGTPAEVMVCPRPRALEPSRSLEGKTIPIRGAYKHNLKGIDVNIPLNQLVVLTGVSGSGKSTFMFDILDKVAKHHFNRVVTVDQVTIRNTRSSRSNVATYTKLFNGIREVFAALPDAKGRGFGADQFSFNASNERCENCQGAGVVAIDMAFMPDVETECPVCQGMRFNEDLLSVKFQGHSIADILDMTVTEAVPVFREYQNIFAILNLMDQVGLGYLKLGQSTSTLSGGEAQRIKLASELSKSGKESTLYLLDEPTTGLHPREVEKLLDILEKLVAKGDTVVMIEHHLDAICAADTIIDFGPGGGLAGGEIVAIGAPQEVAVNPASLTGQCLKVYLGQASNSGSKAGS